MKSNVLFPPNLSVKLSLKTGNAIHVKHGGGESVSSAPVLATRSVITGGSPLPSSSSLHPYIPKTCFPLNHGEHGAGARQRLHKAVLHSWVSRSCSMTVLSPNPLEPGQDWPQEGWGCVYNS